MTHGFVEGYTNWSHHGEIPSKQVAEDEEEEVHAVEPIDDDDVVGGNG